MLGWRATSVRTERQRSVGLWRKLRPPLISHVRRLPSNGLAAIFIDNGTNTTSTLIIIIDATDGQAFVFGSRSSWVNRCLILLRVNRHPDCCATLARWKRTDPATVLPFTATCQHYGAACQDVAHLIIHCHIGPRNAPSIFPGRTSPVFIASGTRSLAT
jgi:hypothetical protein